MHANCASFARVRQGRLDTRASLLGAVPPCVHVPDAQRDDEFVPETVGTKLEDFGNEAEDGNNVGVG